MLGLGALSLPSAFARLGWAGAVSTIVLGGVGMAFSGVLFSRLGMRVPKARVRIRHALVFSPTLWLTGPAAAADL